MLRSAASVAEELGADLVSLLASAAHLPGTTEVSPAAGLMHTVNVRCNLYAAISAAAASGFLILDEAQLDYVMAIIGGDSRPQAAAPLAGAAAAGAQGGWVGCSG